MVEARRRRSGVSDVIAWNMQSTRATDRAASAFVGVGGACIAAIIGSKLDPSREDISMSIRRILILCLALLPFAVAAQEAYRNEVEAWRTQRYENLKKPEGYLSYVGSGLVSEGEHRVGSAPDNDIVLPYGPAHLGRLTFGLDGHLSFVSAPDGEGRIAGKPIGEVTLKTQLDEGGPTRIDFASAWFYLVKMGDLIGWRLRDTQSPLRQHFTGIPHFDVDPSWRVVARWEPFDLPRTLEYITVLGTPEQGAVSGQAVFERDGQRYTLWPTDAENGQLFFVFADRTSGKITYGGGRFLYADAPKNGEVVLDFNRAYNPPCALNAHVVCPTAPPENRLRLAVEAGEKKPAGH